MAFVAAAAAMAPIGATSLENTTNQAIVDRAPETVGPVGPGVRAPTGNPLWAVALELLSVTRERPLFSPSRRPPQPPVVVAPQIPPANPPKPAEPDYPLLVLMGTIVGESGGIGIFLDRTASE